MADPLKEFESAWQRGEAPSIESYLTNDKLSDDSKRLRQFLSIEVRCRMQRGHQPSSADYVTRFPKAATLIDEVIAEAAKADTKEWPTISGTSNGGTAPIDMQDGQITRIGPYRLIEPLGKGAFGAVYKAFDEELDRYVAIKVTLQKFVKPEDKEEFLKEARMVASLKHDNIVRALTLGSTDTGDYFLVSDLVSGQDLSKYLHDKGKLPPVEAVGTVAAIADALHYSHGKGLVHRDVKPANILIDENGKAFLTDFGVALRDEDLGRGPDFVGTPHYMSPEQVSAEAHRVDGRSDIFSLGVVLYQLLTGQKPFRGDTRHELMEQIINMEAKPLRQVDDSIPVKLEQICLKAMSKQVGDRYLTASDFAQALRSYDKVPWPLITSVLAAAMIGISVLVWITSGLRTTNADTTANEASAELNVGSNASADPIVKQFEILKSKDQQRFIALTDRDSLVNGDSVRFSVQLNQPAFIRLLWIDTEGVPVELYPNDPESGHRGIEEVTMMQSPDDGTRAWPLEGRGGLETALLLVSNEPLQDLPLEGFKTGLANDVTTDQVLRFSATRTNAAVKRNVGDTRSLGKQTVQIDDAVLGLLERIRKHVDIVEAIAIPHRSSE